MKAKRVICVIKGHKWVVGRAAENWARNLVPDKKCYHNRACSRCEHLQWHADEVDKEADRILQLKKMLGGSEAQAQSAPFDPTARPVDPNEFP